MSRVLHACPAPAKLNLFLHVTGRSANGYHLLQTAFQLIDWCDTLHFEVRTDGAIERRNRVAGIAAEQDLCVRAARLLQAATGAHHCGADITLDKQLPQGAGLGGGSSDAATTLLALNQLWQTGLAQQELMALGLQLGADVPFFLYGGNAFGEGIGERLQPLQTPDCWFIVIDPGVSISTAAIFAAPELTRNSKVVKLSDFSGAACLGFTGGAAKCNWSNDLQAVASRRFPAVAAVLEWLGGYGHARMTGSGACVFCAFETEAQADQVLRQVPDVWRARKARALQQHPLHASLAAQAVQN